MKYLANYPSVRAHPLPQWYADAKFGIFIHWGLYSVPAFAPSHQGDILGMYQTLSAEEVFAQQPYAEWYQNSLRIENSPTYLYHIQKYGFNYPYENFAAEFNRQVQQWQPGEWASLFKEAGAKYVVLVTKHHDGFLLWPSKQRNPHAENYCCERNVVGELAQAVRRQGMRMGFYYSSALDWSFTPTPVRSWAEQLVSGPVTREYRRYVKSHWQELIDQYHADMIWGDIGYPPGENLAELFAYFYNRNPEGLINDRWLQTPAWLHNRIGLKLYTWLKPLFFRQGRSVPPRIPHCDFLTAEYAAFNADEAKKWEATRGVGNSFGYNQFEDARDYLDAAGLIRMLVKIVSKNGNLLLNVGPRADGTIPEAQANAILGLGQWLKINGEAIYATVPWTHPGETLEDGAEVAYTRKGNSLYIHILESSTTGMIEISRLKNFRDGRLYLLGTEKPLDWKFSRGKLRISLPPSMPGPVPVIRLEMNA